MCKPKAKGPNTFILARYLGIPHALSPYAVRGAKLKTRTHDLEAVALSPWQLGLPGSPRAANSSMEGLPPDAQHAVMDCLQADLAANSWGQPSLAMVCRSWKAACVDWFRMHPLGGFGPYWAWY